MLFFLLVYFFPYSIILVGLTLYGVYIYKNKDYNISFDILLHDSENVEMVQTYINEVEKALLKKLESGGIDIHLGYRIPTEGKQSVSIMRVVGFLDDVYAICMENLPFCIREKSRSSSTIEESRSVSFVMILRPFVRVSLSSISLIVSLQPFIAVSGVRSSWETEEINSFFMFSVFSSSSAM